MPTQRTLRHWKVRIKTAFFFPVVALIGWLAGACVLGAWRLDHVDGRMFASALMLLAGIVLAVFCVLLAGEFTRIYRRWQAEQNMQDGLRCVVDTCDEVLRKPYAREPETGRGICLDCLRRIARAHGTDVPQRAREAGA